jgi:hypothetical protein
LKKASISLFWTNVEPNFALLGAVGEQYMSVPESGDTSLSRFDDGATDFSEFKDNWHFRKLPSLANAIAVIKLREPNIKLIKHMDMYNCTS